MALKQGDLKTFIPIAARVLILVSFSLVLPPGSVRRPSSKMQLIPWAFVEFVHFISEVKHLSLPLCLWTKGCLLFKGMGCISEERKGSHLFLVCSFKTCGLFCPFQDKQISRGKKHTSPSVRGWHGLIPLHRALERSTGFVLQRFAGLGMLFFTPNDAALACGFLEVHLLQQHTLEGSLRSGKASASCSGKPQSHPS